MATDHLVPDDIRERYHVKEWRNAAGVLTTASPTEWQEIVEVLRGFTLLRSEVVVGGGNRSLISRRIDGAFYAENAMRCIAVGRKNYLFAGSDTGGERAASIYTIVRTAKLNGRNPEAYLCETLQKIAAGHPINRIDQIMPWTTSV